jgi:hypothetical protein
LFRVTVPPAVGLTVTVNVYVLCVNVAVTALLAFIVTVAGFADPERSPLQPEKT